MYFSTQVYPLIDFSLSKVTAIHEHNLYNGHQYQHFF